METCWSKEGFNCIYGCGSGGFLPFENYVINEKLYVQRGKDIVWQQIGERVVTERKKNLVQFALVFHLLS